MTSNTSSVNPDTSKHEMLLLHHEDTTTKKTKITVTSSTEKLSQSVTCGHCDEKVNLRVKSATSLRFRYFILLLPSLVIGTYLIVSRAINEGLDTLVLSLILYTLFGFIGYLIVMTKLLNSFLSLVTTKSSTHSIQPR